MYVEQYAQQRMNELQADREGQWRKIAEHWNEDSRTVPASKWAIVRVLDRLRARRRTVTVVGLPDGARPPAADADGQQAVWPADSVAGRFVQGGGIPPESTADRDRSDQRELVTTR
jgi:hypothetical protein